MYERLRYIPFMLYRLSIDVPSLRLIILPLGKFINFVFNYGVEAKNKLDYITDYQQIY